MPASEQSSLTGVWEGLYSYPDKVRAPPTPFTTFILESGFSLSGTVHETGQVGAALGKALTATIDGSRDGNDVRFLKVYAASTRSETGGYRFPVTYRGVLSADGTEIEGTWSIGSNWSGKFLMIRSPPPTVAAEAREEQLEPVGTR